MTLSIVETTIIHYSNYFAEMTTLIVEMTMSTTKWFKITASIVEMTRLVVITTTRRWCTYTILNMIISGEMTTLIVKMTMSENKLIRIHSFNRKRTNVIFVSTILFRNTIQIWNINMRISCGLNSSKTYMKERLNFKFLYMCACAFMGLKIASVSTSMAALLTFVWFLARVNSSMT